MRYLPGLVPTFRLPGSRGPAIVAAVLRSVPSIGATRSAERIRRGWQMQFEVVGPQHSDILADLLPTDRPDLLPAPPDDRRGRRPHRRTAGP